MNIDNEREREPGAEEDEEMPATERELAEDAAWKRIQQNTFTRWANEHLKTVSKHMGSLETDLADGLRLISLVEVLSGKKLPKHNKRPGFRSQKLENVSVALKFLEDGEGIRIVNIDSSDIVDCKLKLILGLIWTLILHYSISMPMWEGEEDIPHRPGESPTPKQRLLGWIQSKIPDLPITNFTSDWNDGRAVGALVDAVAPGLCPDWQDWNPKNAKQNATEAMKLAEDWLGVPQLIRPEEMVEPKVDELSMMTYLSQFPAAKLKPGAPLRPRTNPNRVRAYGPGIEPNGVSVGAPARFTVETFSAGQGKVEIFVENPKGELEPVDIKFNNDRNLTYSISYTPRLEGPHKVKIIFATKEIPKSPYNVMVEGHAGDASKVTAKGPGLEPSGVMIGKSTYFEVFTKDAGRGQVEVIVLDPQGHKNSVQPVVKQSGDSVWRCDYIAQQAGLHSVNVFFAGRPIPNSPFAVKIAPGTVPPAGPPKPGQPGIAPAGPPKPGQPGTAPPPKPGKPGTAPPAGPPKPGQPAGPPIAPPIVGPPKPAQPVSDAKKVRAIGRGLQAKGVRCRDIAEFKVYTEGAGEGKLEIKIIGPGGVQEKVEIKKINETTYECIYRPVKEGKYTAIISYGGAEISRSPFEVMVAKFWDTKIRAYGPGLEGGMVGSSADFTVETNGETGALGFSIEGPSQAKIDCKDNGDGSADVKYWPTAPGDYAVHILCNDEDIPRSPYIATIQPKITDCFPDKVKAFGPGLEKSGVTAGKPTEFTIDTRQAGKAALKITALDEEYNPVNVQIRDNKDGTYICSYTAIRNIKHSISISYGGVAIPNSPYRVYVSEPTSPNKVKVYGPGVEKGVKSNQPTYFIVDCKQAGPGEKPKTSDIQIALTDEKGKDVPFKVNDNGDGTFKIDYSAPTPGTYKVTVFFAGREIPSSPIKVVVAPHIDVSKIKVEGLEPKACLNSQQEVKILTKSSGQQISQAQLILTTPSGKNMQAPVRPSDDGFVSTFSPVEVGEYKINAIVDSVPVFAQPFKMQSVPGGDPTKVKAYGPGLTSGLANQPANFTIDTRKAGQAPLGVTVEGPCEAVINCKDNGDGTCGVVYQPTVPGDYNVNVTYASLHIPGSPFKASIKPSPKDVSGIKTYGPGIEQGAFLDSTTEFTVDARSVTKTGESVVRALITNSSGTKTDALVQNNNDGTYKVSYTPFEEGQHSLEITYDSIPIPNTPHKVKVVRGCDPSRCKAYGPGLQSGFTNQPAQFTVETKGAGTGGLGLAVEGPSEAKMTCKDNRDGTCSVEYFPTEPGDYDIAVKFADHHIPGSPFKVHVATPVDASKVTASGPGLEPQNCRSNVPVTFKVDTTKAGRAPLGVDITADKGGPLQKPQLKSNNDGTFDVTYVPPAEGTNCTMRVTYGGKDIQKSPFHMKVLPTCEPQKVKVTGPGINKAGLPASIPVDFVVDTKEAGFGDLEVFVKGPEGDLKKVKVIDQKDGTFKVSYTPDDIGVYNIVVKYGGQEVPNSPFQVKANPTGDASMCKITEGLQQTVVMGQECCVTVNAKQAGKGAVTCRIRSSSGTDLDIDIEDNGDGTFSIFYNAKDAGEYTINLKFGGQAVPQGTYTIRATTEEVVRQTTVEQYQKTTTTTTTTATSTTFRPVELRNIPVSTAGGTITGEVKMPSGKTERPTIVDNKDGTVTVKYEPKEVGLHELHVKYNKEHVQGSPFKFHVDAVNSGYVTAYGSGLTHGICGEPCNFTIVTKDAGAGGLALAVEGPSKAEITCQDNKDGTCSVSYLPTAPGEYKIVVKFDDKHINGSPFSAKITGEGRKRSQISVGSSSEVSLKVTETDIKNLNASIKSPSGLEEPCFLKKLPNGHLGISFTPREKGEHLVYVKRQGTQIAGSPFKIMVGESEIGDATKVKVFGKALKEGMTQVLNEFTINTKEAGYGGLSLSVEGPSRADIQCNETPDGSLNVGYKPTEPGFYIINIKFADHHVPGSPFTARIAGEGSNRQTEKISRKREAVPVTSVGSECELSLKIPGTSPMDMAAQVTSPGGVTHDADICAIADFTYTVKFVPVEMGIHTVSIKHKELHIPGSPFQFTVGPFKDQGAHKVHAGGPGLERGEVNETCEFNVWTREAGPGNLSIAVEGPSKAEIDFKDRKDGSCYVSYTVPQHGEYTVSVKFNDQHIPDSPFKVYITPSLGEARRLEVAALQETGLQINKPVAFTVLFNGAKGHLDAKVVAPSGAEDDAFLTPIDDDTYAVRFIPHENGIHYIHVRFDGVHIRGSPFRVRVGKEEADPAAVTAYGKGLESAESGQKTEFIVNTCNAGAGTLAVTIDGPSKVSMDCSEVDDGYRVRYTPLAPGDYFITIKYSGVHIAGSPFKVHCAGQVRGGGGLHETSSVVVETVTKTSTQTSVKPILPKFNSDASKVQSKGIGLKKAYMQKQNMFTVDCQDAGQNILMVGVYGPKHPCEEVFIKHLGRNTFQVNYVIKERGEYVIIVKWGEDHIPGSPFQVIVQ